MNTKSGEQILVCTRDGARKFWQVAVNGETQTVRWGRIGTLGQTLTRTFGGLDEAQKATGVLIAQKVAKGYVEVSREEADALLALPMPRAEKSGAPAEFQLLLPFDEAAANPDPPVFVVADAKSANEPSLSLFDF